MRNQFAVATFNLLNLHDAQTPFYDKEGYTLAQYNEKCDWIAHQLDNLDADIVGFQEVWSEKALADAVRRSSKMSGAQVIIAPGAIQGNKLPKVGIVSRLPLIGKVESIQEIPASLALDLPGPVQANLPVEPRKHALFSRPILKAQFNLSAAHDTPQILTVFVLHLKSKRPNAYEVTVNGEQLREDLDDAATEARASLRSLIMRGIEATAVRSLVLQTIAHSNTPTIVLGDFNDSADSVTTEIITGRSAPFDKAGRDTTLFNAADLTYRHKMTRDVTYSHVHQDDPGTLDHVLVSEEFLPNSKFSQFVVQKVDFFNDHLNERNPLTSDHGVVRVRFRSNAVPTFAATKPPSLPVLTGQ